MQEEELQNVFDGLIRQHNLVVKVDEPLPKDIKIWALDVEHDEQGGYVGCGFYNGTTNICYYFSDIVLLNSIDFCPLSLICHNGVSDFDVLRSWGINVRDNQLFWDTGLISHIIDSSRKGYGLKKLAEADLNIKYPSYDDIVGHKTFKQVKERRTLDKWPVSIVSLYNAMDCFVTWKLYELQRKQKPNLAYFNDLERPLSFILSATESRGICVDLPYLEGLKRELEAWRAPIEAEIKNELGDINLNSPKQLLEALYAKEIYPEFKGKPSTDKRALQTLGSNPIVSLLLRFSEIDTLLSSFIYPYLDRRQEVVHPWFNQCGTRTGRLSCSNPNLLQIPRRTENGRIVRNMFVPRSGMVLGEADYAAIEPRVLAHLSKDPNLCNLFKNGLDFHSWTAERLNISRDKAKVLNLSVGYRATFKSVMSQLGCDKDEANKQIEAWWSLFSTLRRWQDNLLYDAKRSGFITTLLGLRIKVDGLTDGNPWKRESAERQAINNVTQGSAAEIIKMAMIKLSGDSRLSSTFGLLIQIYDSLVFESSEIEADAKVVTECMEQAMKLDIPLVAELKTGLKWGEMKCPLQTV